MIKLVLVSALISLNSFASEEVLLKLRRERPFVHCDISKDSVKITRVVQGVKFSKVQNYKIDDFKSLIIEARNMRNETDLSTEHMALDVGSDNSEYFYLSLKEPKSLKLTNLMTALCELRSL